MSQILKSDYKKSPQDYREKLIQLLYHEIIFLGKSYSKTKFYNEKKLIKNAGHKLQKMLNKQKNQRKIVLAQEGFQKIIMSIYQTIEEIIKKM